MEQRESCQKGDADEKDNQKAEEKKGIGLGTDANQYKSKKNDDLRPRIQVVDWTLYGAVMI
jgi:hypothetical protein